MERDLEKTKTISVDYESETAKSRWAVIVAASYGWANYRHQADALYLYHLLKNLKEPKDRYDDDHIILILADDIATGWRNKKPGEIYARLNGENLYTNDVQIDYLLSELTSDDMVKIMKGETIDVTIRSTDKELHPKLVETPTAMSDSENKRFRKMLIIAEPCYSASVLHVAEGFTGVLAFTAASGSESSFADLYSVELKVWLSNRFTHNFTDKIASDRTIVYADLYKFLVLNTIGSHVQLFNAEHFGNLYVTFPAEFFDMSLAN
ncbi:MAG: hypothetical protein IJP62_14235 [Treponema sp.]|nr:hypothetical protein [Treponema sp.]